jgi:glycosyltransferase involved in cell wall biosynthesis
MTYASPKLAIFLPDLVVGGAERSMLKLADGIAQHGYLVDLVLSRAYGPLLSEVPNTVNLVDLGAKRVISSLPSLIRYLKSNKPDSLLSGLHTNLIALWAWRLSGVKTRVIVSERNTLGSESRYYSSDIRMKLMPLLVRLFYPWAKCIVAVSSGVADDLIHTAKLPRERINVIYNPIITPDFQSKTKVELNHNWFKQNEPPTILSVGRLSAQKGYDTLLRAFSQVRKIKAARLLILGEGEERPALEALIHQLGIEQFVSMPGFVRNPYPYMCKSSLFVLSSRWEGLPGVLIEALYCGVPLVSTDCPGGAREILADGKYGCLVPVDDIDAMSQAMLAALRNEIPRSTKESWQPYELQLVVDQYTKILFDEHISVANAK